MHVLPPRESFSDDLRRCPYWLKRLRLESIVSRSGGYPPSWRSMVTHVDELRDMAATVGKLWKSHRKIMPLSIQEGVLDLLLLLREVILLHVGRSLASNVQEARANVRTLLQL